MPPRAQTAIAVPQQRATLPLAPWPYFSEDEIQTVERVLRSGRVNYLTGDEGTLFEAEFAQFAGCRYGVALANGTLALELALIALGIGAGDEVITAARTFVASASCAVMRGARPVLVDVDPESQNLTADTIRPAITTRTKAIIVVHLAGWPCDMDPILELAREHGIKVIEDCAQAHGAEYKGRPVGSMGDVAAFSFCQDKIITLAGEGGLLTTNDESIWRKSWEYKDHGKNWESFHNQHHDRGYRWLHDSFGTNWRLTEMQSALGRVLLGKLPEWVNTRRRFAQMLTAGFKDLAGLRVTVPKPEIKHSYYKYYAFLRLEQLKSGWTRDRVLQEISAQGVPCMVGSCGEIYLEKAFPAEWRPAQRFAVAQELFASSLMFLVHPTLTDAHIEQTVSVVKEVMSRATR